MTRNNLTWSAQTFIFQTTIQHCQNNWQILDISVFTGYLVFVELRIELSSHTLILINKEQFLRKIHLIILVINNNLNTNHLIWKSWRRMKVMIGKAEGERNNVHILPRMLVTLYFIPKSSAIHRDPWFLCGLRTTQQPKPNWKLILVNLSLAFKRMIFLARKQDDPRVA